jgi:hypothetical protein
MPPPPSGSEGIKKLNLNSKFDFDLIALVFFPEQKLYVKKQYKYFYVCMHHGHVSIHEFT